VDAQNKSNTFISYYSWGSVLGLGLDLMLRSNFKDVTLDDYMRGMWKKYGKTEQPYTLTDLENTLAEVTDSTEFATQFFKRYIRKGRYIDLKPLLAQAGFLLQKAHPGEAVLAYNSRIINFEGGKATISENTTMGSPLYKAGLDVDDEILSIDGEPISNARQLNRLLASHKPGDRLSVTSISLGDRHESTVTLAKNPEWELLTYEQAGMEVTQEMKGFRQNWLGSKAGS